MFPDLLLEVPEFPESQRGRDEEEEEGDGHHTDVAARVEESRPQGEGDGPRDRPAEAQHGQPDHPLSVRNRTRGFSNQQ